MSVTQKFRHGVAWMAVGNWVEQAVNFGVFVTLARLLGAEDYGLLAMASVFVVLSEALVRESLSEYLIATRDPGPQDLNATFWLLTGLGLLLALGIVAISGPVALVYGQPAVRWIIMALSPSVIMIALTAVPVAILRRELAFRILALRAIAGVVVGGAVGIGMALQGFGVWSFVGQWLALIGTNSIMAWFAVDWRPGFQTTRSQLARVAGFGAKVLVLRAGELAATQMPMMVMGATLGPVATGLFSVAWRLVETLSFLITTPLRMASQSAFAALSREGGSAGALLLDISKLTGMIALPFFTGLAVLADPIIALVFGPGWAGAAPVLSVMAGLGLYFSFSRIQQGFCLAAGQAGAISALAWMVVALGAVAIWAVSGLGVVAVAVALVGAHYLLWPLHFRIVSKISGVPALSFVTCHALPSLMALVMAVAVAAVAHAMEGASAPVMLSVTVPVGAGVFGVLALTFLRDRFDLFRTYVTGAGTETS